jgi:hypothetical protein
LAPLTLDSRPFLGSDAFVAGAFLGEDLLTPSLRLLGRATTLFLLGVLAGGALALGVILRHGTADP